jgi:hypothetical protein
MKQGIKKNKMYSVEELSLEQLLEIKGGHNPWADTMDENNPWVEEED